MILPRQWILYLCAVLLTALFHTGCLLDFGDPQPSFFQRIADETSDNPHALYERGLELYRLREYSEARAYLYRSHRYNPDNLQTIIALVRCDLELESPKRAITYIDKGLALHADHFELLILKSVALMMYQYYDQARLILKSLDGESPTEKALINRAWGDLRYREKDYTDALGYWEKSVAAIPDQPELIERMDRLELYLNGKK
jgi:tetratricopeptide (TPR) repeat protein